MPFNIPLHFGSVPPRLETSRVLLRPLVADDAEALQTHGSEANRTGIARFGINVERAYGAPVAVLHSLAKKIGQTMPCHGTCWKTVPQKPAGWRGTPFGN